MTPYFTPAFTHTVAFLAGMFAGGVLTITALLSVVGG